MSDPSRLPPSPQDYERFEPKSPTDKFKDDAQKRPLYQYGAGLGIAALAGAIYNFRKRGNTKLSLYVIHTRLAVQSAVIGCLVGGMVHQMYK